MPSYLNVKLVKSRNLSSWTSTLLSECSFLYTKNLKYSSGTYPSDKLDKAWKKLMLNQFHDVLPGTSIKEVHTIILFEKKVGMEFSLLQ